ncbi:flagellar basal body L-ring protein FlgH [Helicobacter cappadocius]|uniref:Flagellar L-ring protein n=1 Tax=Helicobacter cappadocius TaxID=3063998 RepID=A0AA90TF24_9HELI|nr:MULTISPECIES: flagellar basal body L-ring protein FlgH [unclassified Helicobacter]MDO7253360.1 flagellar basal body L-ring protein FlgH [Helicobacter sp. faydin-H75]MDP2539210.1 flagellar basal body L-ring protein FlgH [Helicobacter sp. faydin-H76]
MNIFSFKALCLLCIFGLSLGYAYEPEIDMNPPSYVEEMPSKDFIPEFSKTGSLFGQGDRPLFADRRAMKPDDLITVLINETSNANYTASKTYNTASGGNSNPPRLTYNGSDESKKKSTEFLDNQTNYSMVAPTNNSNFKGGGNQSKSENLTLTLTARVVKVLENGNYFIYGNKEVLVDGEKQIIQISGVIRPYDISRNNTIESKYISDAKIRYANIGSLSNTNKKKMATDVLESEWPY